jgi:hypothetical protein
MGHGNLERDGEIKLANGLDYAEEERGADRRVEGQGGPHGSKHKVKWLVRPEYETRVKKVS